MGGDETARNFWEKSEQIKALMQKRKENMKSILTEDQLKKMKEQRAPIKRKRKVLS